MKNNTLFNIFGFAKFMGFLGLILGLSFGILYSFGGLIIDSLVSLDLISGDTFGTLGLSYGTFLAFGALIGMPIILGVGGFILGFALSPFYRLYSREFGSI